MKHPKTRLPEYADRALPEPERRRVEEHLESCAECRSELEGLSRVSGLLAGLPKRPLPPGFLARLQARRLREEGAPSLFRLPPRARAAAFAMAGALAVFAVFDRAQMLLKPDDWPNGAASFLGDEESPEARPRPASEAAARGEGPKDDGLRPGLGLKLAKARGEPTSAAPAAIGGLAFKTAGLSGGSGRSAAPARGHAARSAMTNEVLHDKLEAEKKKLGIRRIIPPQPVNPLSAQFSQLRGADQAERLVGAPSPAMVSGPTPKLIAADTFGPQSGQPVASPVPAAPAPEALVLGSRGALEEAWSARGLPGAPPAADFETKRVLLLLPPAEGLAVEIAAVRERARSVIVSWRLIGASAKGPAHAVELLPRSDKPVVLQAAE